jgi:hypothetical protein
MDYSENTITYPGSSSFSPGKTPFGYFDSDAIFQEHADKFASFAANHLGYPVLEVELQDVNFYTAFEGAIIEYSNQVNQVNIANNLLNTLGIQTGSQYLQGGLTGKAVGTSLSYITKLSKAYGTEADSGGNVKWHKAYLNVETGVQKYSIREAVASSLSMSLSNTSSIEIKRVLHTVPPAIVRYFDPFVGTGLGSQQLLDSFDFGGMSPSVNFMMMPIHSDLLRIQSIEFNDRIRKSHFSFEIHGDDIVIYPVPGAARGNASTPYFEKVWFEFLFEEEKSKDALLFGNTAVLNGVISDASNIPYNYQQYSTINDMGRAWILRYGLAIAKEMLGRVRGKYSTVPIPNSEVTLNGSELVSEAASEKSDLITQLREFLGKMTRESMLQRQATEDEASMNVLSKVPTKLYIG